MVMHISCSGYPAPQLDEADASDIFTGVEEKGPRPGNLKKKGNPQTRTPAPKGPKPGMAEEENGPGSDLEEEGDPESPDNSDVDPRALAHLADETPGTEPISNEDSDVSRLDLDEPDSVADKKASSPRKPSKKAIEKALKEVRDSLAYPVKSSTTYHRSQSELFLWKRPPSPTP